MWPLDYIWGTQSQRASIAVGERSGKQSDTGDTGELPSGRVVRNTDLAIDPLARFEQTLQEQMLKLQDYQNTFEGLLNQSKILRGNGRLSPVVSIEKVAQEESQNRVQHEHSIRPSVEFQHLFREVHQDIVKEQKTLSDFYEKLRHSPSFARCEKLCQKSIDIVVRLKDFVDAIQEEIINARGVATSAVKLAEWLVTAIGFLRSIFSTSHSTSTGAEIFDRFFYSCILGGDSGERQFMLKMYADLDRASQLIDASWKKF